MLQGAWPTYLAFIFPILGVILFTGHYFIRKSSKSMIQKIIIQSSIIALLAIVGHITFKIAQCGSAETF